MPGERSAMRITLLFTLLVLAACGGEKPQPPATRSVVATVERYPAPKPVATSDPAVVIKPEAPCEPKLGTSGGMLTIDSLASFIELVKSCDPFKKDFTTDGKVRDDNWEPEYIGGRTVLGNLQGFAYVFKDLGTAFENLPILKQREILQPTMKLVAAAVVEYIHRSHLEEYLLQLNWERDIASVSPGWYGATSWPDDRFQRVPVSAPDGEGSRVVSPERKLSKIDLWVRLFWRRRGELVFKTAQEEVRAALAAKK